MRSRRWISGISMDTRKIWVAKNGGNVDSLTVYCQDFVSVLWFNCIFFAIKRFLWVASLLMASFTSKVECAEPRTVRDWIDDTLKRGQSTSKEGLHFMKGGEHGGLRTSFTDFSISVWWRITTIVIVGFDRVRYRLMKNWIYLSP